MLMLTAKVVESINRRVIPTIQRNGILAMRRSSRNASKLKIHPYPLRPTSARASLLRLTRKQQPKSTCQPISHSWSEACPPVLAQSHLGKEAENLHGARPCGQSQREIVRIERFGKLWPPEATTKTRTWIAELESVPFGWKVNGGMTVI